MIAGTATRRPPPTSIATPGPNQTAQRLTGRDYLSYSAISTFQRCPLRYRFAYVAGLTPEFVSSSLVFGGAIHSAIELHCRRAFEGVAPPSIDELVAAYERYWSAEATVPVKFGKGESADSLRDLARRMLAAYQASEVSKLDGSPLGIEEELRGSPLPGCPDLLGRVDLILLTDDVLRVIDFKTARARWSGAKIQEAAPQMHVYAELVEPLARALGAHAVRLEWIVLTKTKNPAIETHAITPERSHVARTMAVVRRVWEAIQAGYFYPSPSSMSCSGCPHRTACREWEG